jgi:hypothetical protein
MYHGNYGKVRNVGASLTYLLKSREDLKDPEIFCISESILGRVHPTKTGL